ncbi:uncharacterized protein OCT59_000497 [Rhizophagus irregularis]|uniref:F-box domain-containing protein n=2 Tax=Rhizophagus irregularis TaxID=588596 RepID=A0A015IIX6_RHIIW|nr:hypothetical protein RirG_210120 [Rhizophagus irregularis DAOM 197198w]UZN99217.1 hypothetical protein OCT59_000497 [Rhizophagus irregularis]
MACTKIFSGNFPEITNGIIQYFRNDFSTLHSCILVNRLWCRMTIPLLWENPFLLKEPKNHYYIGVYLYNLSDDDIKKKLKEYGINNDDSFPLFNYSSFIQYLDTYEIINSIENWVSDDEKFPLFAVYIKSLGDFIRYIFKLLIKIFNENEANLHTLDITYYKSSYDDTIFSELISNSNFIYNIRNFYFKFYTINIFSVDDTLNNNNLVNRFLKLLSSNCDSISSLYFLSTHNSHLIIEKDLCHLIDSQQDLKKISLSFNNLSIYNSILLSKIPNCTDIIFSMVDFKNLVVSNEIIEQLNVLESIHIIYCRSLNSNFFQQIINLTEPFKLKSLFIDEAPLTKQQLLLLQKSGNYLENFGFELNDVSSLLTQEQELFELLIKNCSNIKFLKFYGFKDQNIYKIFQLVKKIELNLNYLTIDTDSNANISTSIILQNLGQILPPKLEYLNLILTITNTSDFEFFLKNLQTNFIKKLLIKDTKNKEPENQNLNNLPYIKEYIMKKKRSEHLALLECFITPTHHTVVDLYSFKDEVEEFSLYNIMVLDYINLNIEANKFIHDMY